MDKKQKITQSFNATTPLADRTQSLDASGFTVGHPSPELAADRQTCVNHTGVTYYWTAFQAADGEMKVGTYPGDGLDNHNISGVGFQPDYVLVMSANTSAAVWQRSSLPWPATSASRSKG